MKISNYIWLAKLTSIINIINRFFLIILYNKWKIITSIYRYNVLIINFLFYVLCFLCFREHPSTIKKRFFSVFIMTLISPAPLYFGLNEQVFQKVFKINLNNSDLFYDNYFCRLYLIGNYLGIAGTTMVGFNTGDCDTITPNNDPVPRSLESTGI